MIKSRLNRPWTEIIALRSRGTRATVVLGLVAALGGWVWLGPVYAGVWLATVMAATLVNRLICAWMLGRPRQGPALEWSLAGVTFIYTVLFCALPYGLAVFSDENSAWIAAVAMLGAIALSSTSEFVISRRVGFGSISALLGVSLVIVFTRGRGEPIANLIFAAVAVLAFFACLLQFAMHRVRDDRRFLAAVAEAEGANAAKSMFLATMSHEIRTPLNGVLGMAQAMAADDLDSRQRERLTILQGAGATLTSILNDVLDLSKIEAGKLEVDSLPFDLGDTVRAATQPFAVLASEKGVAVDVTVDPGAAGIYRGDPARLRQVLSNLLSNAVKFTDAGAIGVTVERDLGGVRMIVTDTGPGIPADQVDKLFGKFAQLDATTTRRHGGTGLGLAISRELSVLMGGSISLASEPGKGSAFTVLLPLERIGDAVPADEARADSAPEPKLGLKVMAAEDNRVNQIVLETLLAQVGVTPVMVSDGAQAVEAWANGDWDLILMDVHMPVLDGIGAVREIRARELVEGRRRTPVIALTANAMTHQVAELIAAGMDRHVAKPIDAAVLFEAMESALDEADLAAGPAAP